MKRLSSDQASVRAVSYVYLTVTATLCFLPFLIVISGSLSTDSAIMRLGYGILPRDFTFDAYRAIFQYPREIIQAYGVTTAVTVIGTTVGLFLTAMTGYVLSRKDFTWRAPFAFFFYFTTLFSGGIVPWYILITRYLGLGNRFLALVLPVLFNVFHLIIMKSFMATIPDEIVDAAKIDGAGTFYTFVVVVLPIAKPALASIGLFIALQYWNDWFLAWLFIRSPRLYSLQFLLYRIVAGAQALRDISMAVAAGIELPRETLKLAITIVATGPIMLAYPFVQRYFVKGLTIGAVKG